MGAAEQVKAKASAGVCCREPSRPPGPQGLIMVSRVEPVAPSASYGRTIHDLGVNTSDKPLRPKGHMLVCAEDDMVMHRYT